MPRIIDRIVMRFRNKANFLRPAFTWDGWEGLTCMPFGELVFQNVVELLTDLVNDVTFTLADGRGMMTFAEFKRFFEDYGEMAMWRVYRHGFAVVGVRSHEENGVKVVTSIRLLDADELVTVQDHGDSFVKAKDPTTEAYVMKSTTYRTKGVSDWQLCKPAIEFLDNTLNASNTAVKKLGAFVVASPDNGGSMAPTVATLKPEDKKEMEKTISKEYGLLSKQRQIMLLPRGMKFETVSLTNLDQRLTERVRMAVELIADRIKVPASQIAVIDATAGKSLSNGGEVHEGDSLKYKTFERMLNKTFVAFATWLGIKVDYTIYNKPADAVTGAISQEG